MDTIKKRTTLVGIVTLIVGLALGLGSGVWFVKNSQAGNAPAAQLTLGSTAPKDEPLFGKQDDWDPFRQMERMQEEIDRAIRNATEQFRLGPGATVFRPNAGYSSSFDLRDRKDHYELRAYLPDVKASDVNVRIDNERTLHVSVTQRKQETKNANGGSASVTELGQYEQVVTLPEPVKSSEMKIDRNGHEIVITIPKATTRPKENAI
jgi:HSP20 family molecular chaperone IbpA